MPRNITEFRVLLSCPDEVRAEAQVIVGALTTLNVEFEQRGIRLRALNWRSDVVPGVGSDPQEVINSQLEYDIYVGLLGAYFGSPTPRAGSGTEEEFHRAFKLFSQHPDSVRLLFYFKSSSSNVLDIDLGQLEKVRGFRRTISSSGVLYSTFDSPDDLLQIVTVHLRNLIETQWTGTDWKHTTGLAIFKQSLDHDRDTNLTVTQDPTDDEAEGVWDIAATMAETGEVVNAALSNLTAGAAVFGERLKQSTAAVANPELTARQRKDIIDMQAQAVRDYASVLSSNIPGYQAGILTSLECMEKLWALYVKDEVGEDVGFETTFTVFTDFAKTVRDLRQQMQWLKGVVVNTPRLTKDLAIAKKRLVSQFDAFTSAATLFLAKSHVLIGEISSRLHSDAQ